MICHNLTDAAKRWGSERAHQLATYSNLTNLLQDLFKVGLQSHISIFIQASIVKSTWIHAWDSYRRRSVMCRSRDRTPFGISITYVDAKYGYAKGI